MSVYKFLNESLLNNVETDEVEDVENDVSIGFSLKITAERKITDNEYVKFLREHMRSAAERFGNSGYRVGLDGAVMKTDALEGRIKIQRNLDVYDFCNLFVQMFFPKDCNCFGSDNPVNFDLEVSMTGYDYYEYVKCMFADGAEKKTLKICKTSTFLSFFHELFPEDKDDAIIKCFVSAFRNWKKENGKAIEICFDYEGSDRTYFIYANGNMLSGMHLYGVGDFQEGFVQVNKDGKWNFIDTEGKCISDDWFDAIGNFYEGFAQVKKNDKWNFINTSGNCISKRWFDLVWDFQEGFARVKKGIAYNFYNFIDTEGKCISDDWFDFDYVCDFREGFARVKKNGKWNFIDTEGKFISNEWFDFNSVLDFQEGLAQVKKNRKWNFIDTTGKCVLNDWFDDIGNFYEGFAQVKKNGKWNLIDTSGKCVLDEWF